MCCDAPSGSSTITWTRSSNGTRSPRTLAWIRSRFGRGFKLSTGMTPHQYIIRCRLRRAMKLLARDELTLADIALEVGCSCQSHLTTLFRKHLGTTPGAFRLSAREGQRRPAQISSVSSRNAPNQGAMRGQRSGFAAARIQAQ